MLDFLCGFICGGKYWCGTGVWRVRAAAYSTLVPWTVAQTFIRSVFSCICTSQNLVSLATKILSKSVSAAAHFGKRGTYTSLGVRNIAHLCFPEVPPLLHPTVAARTQDAEVQYQAGGGH